MSELIDRQAAIDALDELCDRECEYSKQQRSVMCGACHLGSAFDVIEQMPSAEPQERKGEWILDRSGAYCCSKCMEPCATYVMMKPRDKFCKMCGSRNEVKHGSQDN